MFLEDSWQWECQNPTKSMGVGMGIGIAIGFSISLIAAAVVYYIQYRQRKHRLLRFWRPGPEIRREWGDTGRAFRYALRAIDAERDWIDRRRTAVWIARAILDFETPERLVREIPSHLTYPAVLTARREEAEWQDLPKNREPSGVEHLSLPPPPYSGPREVF